MKICHVIEAAGGGSGRVVLDLAQAALAAGHQVTVIYAPERAETAFIASLQALPGLVIATSPMRRAVGLHDFVDGWKLFRCLRQLGPFDVVHSHSSKAGALTRLAGLFLFRPVQIYTPHAFVSLAPGTLPWYGWIERLLSWFTDAIIAVSRLEDQHARRTLGIAPAKLHVVPNGINPDVTVTRSQARHEMKFQESDFIVGFVGRLVPQKNPQRAVQAFAVLAVDHPEARLVIVGDGELQPELIRQLSQESLQDRVLFLTGRNARELMSGFDCLLCSSDYEGFAMIFLEALAAGVPIITTPVGGAEETVLDGITGYRSKDFTSENLAQLLIKLVALTPSERAQMSQQARQQADQFTIQRMATRTVATYQQALAERWA